MPMAICSRACRGWATQAARELPTVLAADTRERASSVLRAEPACRNGVFPREQEPWLMAVDSRGKADWTSHGCSKGTEGSGVGPNLARQKVILTPNGCCWSMTTGRIGVSAGGGGGGGGGGGRRLLAKTRASDARRYMFGAFGTSSPPTAEKRGNGDPYDPYDWLRNGGEREITRHLEKENAYSERKLRQSAKLERTMLAEMSQRIAEKEEGVPEVIEGWHYYMRTEEGSSFPIYCRRKGSMDSPEEIVLDQRRLAERENYLSIPICKLSPCHSMVAYTADTTGLERYTGYIRDISSGEVLDSIRDVSSIEWGGDSATIFYTVPDEKRRPCKVYRRVVAGLAPERVAGGAGGQKDELLLHEEDEAFFLDVGKTKDKGVITFNSNSKMTSEVHVLSAAAPTGTPRLVRRRERGVEYFVESLGDALVIVTNLGSSSGYCIAQQGRGATGWQELYVPPDGVKIEDIDVYRGHIAVYERTPMGQQVSTLKVSPRTAGRGGEETQAGGGGLVQRSLSCGFPHETVADLGRRDAGAGAGAAGAAGAPLCLDSVRTVKLPLPPVGVCLQPGANCDFDAASLRVTASTPITPLGVYDVGLEDAVPAKVKERLGGGVDWYKEQDYECELHWAVSHDSVKVPMTIIRKKGRQPGGACLMEVYGGYGVCLDTAWQEERISMLDRGWSIALCHVRGGGELGREWHASGRGLLKSNSTLDAAACARYIADQGISSASRMAIHGTSAGGLVVGAFINDYPQLVAAAIAKVPFVDLYNTMMDPSLPLTEHEYDEWGDMSDPEVRRYIMAYSPYENVKKQQYPAVMVTSSYEDTRVAYWGPAKWVARLRELAVEGSGEILLLTSFHAGHFGEGGRLGRARQISRECAWLHRVMGLPG